MKFLNFRKGNQQDFSQSFDIEGYQWGEETKAEISGNILKLRKKKKLSQAELAQRMGVRQIEIIRIESGKKKVSLYTLEKIAEALGCDLKISLN